ncbi:anti-sigma-D factor RsdA [Mycobacterium sp. ACS4331]|uniref:anti-sigma-D factor RsdA n=1 Tax=Mycobacterium sp. ACS4331 TaxID=1834121 RepID=UPI0007FC140E|nr:anti-sigma-D factor RsdA [Mycobacterium sp. ACS4331]OBF09924.1 hypothetical protein A5727_21730 [Mycobacterium sp. ACS4331]
MPDFTSGPESLEDIARTDMLLDALAGQRRVRPADRADAEIFALLEGWRDDVRGPSATRVVTVDQAAAALEDGLAARRPTQRGSRRGLTLVASTAAAVLGIGGFGALVGGAQPGDAMYGLRTALFGESQAVRDDRVTLAAQTKMAEVQRLIETGDWEQAQAKLAEVTSSVESVDNVEAKTGLIQQYNELSVKVGTRDPNASLPVVAPGEPPVPPPPGVTLLELPPVTTPSTTPGETTPSETPGTTTAPSTAPSETSVPPTESTGPTTEPAQPSDAVTAPTTTPTTATTAPPATSAAPTVTTTAPTTPTTTTPTTTTATTTTAPSQARANTTTPTTVAPALEAPPTSVPTAASPVEAAEEVPQSGNSITTTTLPGSVIEIPVAGAGEEES